MRRKASLARLLPIPLALLVSAATPARAQDSAAAEALFREAKTLVSQGKVAEACPKFQASLELQRTLGTLMNLADCLEQDGKTASAHQRWTEATTMAAELKDDRLAFAEERKKAVAPRVPKLLLDVVAGPEALKVTAGGTEIPSTRFGLPLDQDPGKLKVEVLRDDAVLETEEVTLVEGQTATLKLDLAAIAKRHPPKTKGAPKGPEPRPEQRIAGFVVLGVGLAGVTAFAVLESVALAKRSEADGAGNCVERGDKALCSPQGYDLIEEAGTLAEVGQWVGLGGLAVVGVGITLVLTAPLGEPEQASKTAVVPWVSPHGGGLVVGGAW
jgi:hypothetical protein